ncbi:amino acid adenylation domain-containing protein [Streptomyces avermitilis]
MTRDVSAAVAHLDPPDAAALEALEPGAREFLLLATAVLGLHYLTHDDTPVARIVSRAGGPRTVAVTVDPGMTFAALADAVAVAPHTQLDADHAVQLVLGADPDPGLVPADGFRLVLTLSDSLITCAHDGTPGAELDAGTLVAICGTLLGHALGEAVSAAGHKRPVGEYELLDAAGQDRVLREFNDTDQPFPDQRTLHGIFHDQAVRTPDAVAVSTDTESLTYRELDLRSDLLAHHLRERGVAPGRIVAVMARRCLDLPIALLGILKAGGAYLPLDPAAPARRLADMVAGSDAALVLTPPEVVVPDEVAAPVLRLDDPGLYTGPAPGPQAHGGPGDLAYVIYTSGSTGRPKGVMVEHRSVVNRLAWMQRRYPLAEGDTILQKTPVVFDVSVWELFWWFFAGARMHLLAPEMERFPLAIATTVRRQRVTVMHFVPSMLGVFLDYLDDGGNPAALTSLRWCFSSGESLSAREVTAFGRLLGTSGARLVNLYGPTETTVDVTAFDCAPEPFSGTVPIGRPIDNTRVYVLRHRQPMPVGVFGTLYLGGAGVARGYLGDPELTARRFVPEFGGGEGRMYDTGDIGRWLPSGDVEFLGRTDSQVKIRGIRIDLGEIESVVLELPGVAECVVLLDYPDPSLPTLRTAVSGAADLTADALRAHAAERLPQYMLPVVHHWFARLPRTASGKLDRRALADPSYAEAHGRRL